jgi:predicted nucleic acid-binding protein
MKQVILDTNIIVKLLLDEPDSQEAYKLFAHLQQEGYRVSAPDYMRLEVYSVIRKTEERGEIGDKDARRARDLLQELLVEYVLLDDDLLNQSYQFAQKMGLYVVYDCLFLSVALRKEATFVSNDTKFISAARTLYPSVCTLRSWEKHLAHSS